ncbi:MAG: threonine ammonia-lyase, biosynthetic [Myxococcales bacterium]|nr:threonine ammonia-lyase, biosynthetic [Myxococcales bacterium]
MPHGYIDKILRARVYDVAHETPLHEAPSLSARLGNRVLLKREDLQPVFSFKLRGAYNKMVNLSKEARAAGVIASSAGNHAQGVALSAQRLDIRATIVMPSTTPEIKVLAVKSFGAEVVLFGDTYDEAYERATALAEERQLVFIHPYEDPEVIAGQGTIGVELLRQHPDPIHAVFVPVGGGGLIAGIASYIKYVRPEVKVIGVEPADAPAMYRALQLGRRERLDHVGIFADGVAVRQAGAECFRICREAVDQMILVSTDEICAAIKDIFQDTRGIAEPAGALGVAGLKKYVQQHGTRGENLIAIESGANINFDRLRYVSERTRVGERREALLGVTIPERPGSFLEFCQTIGERAITEFAYRYADSHEAYVFAGLEINPAQNEREELIETLRAKGYGVVDLTDDEMAKTHIRYMVGGRAPHLASELLYRFEFPERPGALLNFLTKLGGRWNISLFHYRNQGGDFGRVLVGVEVPAAERPSFSDFLDNLRYVYEEETDNPAYRLFVAGRRS